MTPDQLAATLARQGLTQADLARLLGINKSRVTGWVKGIHGRPPAKTLPAGVGVYLELREAKGRPQPPPFDPSSEQLKQGAKLLRFCAKRGLNYKQARNLIGYALRRRKAAPNRFDKIRVTERRYEKMKNMGIGAWARWRKSYTDSPETRGPKAGSVRRCSRCREPGHFAPACPTKRREGE